MDPWVQQHCVIQKTSPIILYTLVNTVLGATQMEWTTDEEVHRGTVEKVFSPLLHNSCDRLSAA